MASESAALHEDCPVCQVGGVGRLDIDGPACEKCGMGWDACYDREHDGWCCPECHHHVECDCFKGAESA